MFVVIAAVALLGSFIAGGVASRPDRVEPQVVTREIRHPHNEEGTAFADGTDAVESCIWYAGKNGKMLEDCRVQGTRVRQVK